MSINKIVVGLDGSAGSHAALRWAGGLASITGAEVLVMGVWDHPYLASVIGVAPTPPTARELQELARKGLAEIVDAELGDRADQVAVRPLQGSAASALIHESHSCDLVVVGRKGSGRMPLGSVSRQLAIHAGCPVALVDPIVRWRDDVGLQIAVAVDGSEAAEAALQWTLTELPTSSVEAVFSHDEPINDDPLAPDSVFSRLQAFAEVELASSVATVVDELSLRGAEPDYVEQVVFTGDPRQTIVDFAKSRDVVVVGARSHDGIAGAILGSFASHLLGQAPEGTVVIAHRRRDHER